MKRVLYLLFVVLAGIAMTACGGGGSDDPATTETTGFTAAMLDAGPTYYVSYSGDPDGTTEAGTTQEVYAVSGSGGTYQVAVTDSYFLSDGTLDWSETTNVNVTLNADGTLSATVEGDSGVTTITVVGSTASYLLVTGDYGTDSWDETWYLSKPEGWLAGTGTTETTGFPAAMLDAHPTYYVSYAGDAEETTTLGTTQEVFVVSGSGGTYQVEVTSSYFDADGALVSTEVLSVNATLNVDGTLSATVEGDPSVSTLTLADSTASYLYVTGVEGTESWNEYWYLSQPEGWLTDSGTTEATGFTAEMLDAHPTYYVSYPGDPDGTTEAGTTQEIYAVSGSGGTYQVVITDSYYLNDGTQDWLETTNVSATLNADGTLTVTVEGEPGVTTITLVDSTASYLYVTGDFGTGSWDEFWFLSQPAGWL